MFPGLDEIRGLNEALEACCSGSLYPSEGWYDEGEKLLARIEAGEFALVYLKDAGQ
jgi:hypothetical protein